jgi:hypothetical protein
MVVQKLLTNVFTMIYRQSTIIESNRDDLGEK